MTNRDLLYVLLGIAIAAAMMLFSAIATSAKADPRMMCAPLSEFTKHLETQFKEKVVGTGLTRDNKLIILARSATGSWTLLVVNSQKVACLVAVGDWWSGEPGLIQPEENA